MNELEKILIEIWERVLDVEDITTEDNFFDLGGDSVAVARFAHMLQDRLGDAIENVALFNAPTISQLAVYLAERHDGAIAAVTTNV